MASKGATHYPAVENRPCRRGDGPTGTSSRRRHCVLSNKRVGASSPALARQREFACKSLDRNYAFCNKVSTASKEHNFFFFNFSYSCTHTALFQFLHPNRFIAQVIFTHSNTHSFLHCPHSCQGQFSGLSYPSQI